jgi:hypothetical protein
VIDIARLAVTVSVLDPVPVIGPRTADRLLTPKGIASKTGRLLLHPQHIAASTPRAATPRRTLRFI